MTDASVHAKSEKDQSLISEGVDAGLAAGVNGQSEGYRKGQVCPNDQVGQPNAFTGIAQCLVAPVPYEYTVEPYAVVSGRIDYRLTDSWSAALNIENILDIVGKLVRRPAQLHAQLARSILDSILRPAAGWLVLST